MRKLTTACLVGLGLLALLLHAAPKPSRATVPAELAQARYIALGYDEGARFLSDSEISLAQTRVLPEDREALSRVTSALEKWHKYVITIHPEDAELLIAVRTGRLATGKVFVPTGQGSHGAGIGTELSSADDMLEVYQSNSGHLGALLWRGMLKDGLTRNPPQLFLNFKKDVESIGRH